MAMKLISATPYVYRSSHLPESLHSHNLKPTNSSPYARKVRITLAEKGIPFELQTEVPWDSTTRTPQYNPLEKLPVLITNTKDHGNEDGEETAVYESHFIIEWIETNYPAPKYPSIYPADKQQELFAKQVQVVADGMMDACVLLFFEKQRESPSSEWMARQRRKVDGGLKALSEWVGEREFIIGDKLSLADVAAGSILGYMKVRFQDDGWQVRYPNLKRYSDKLEERESFKDTVPYAQKIQDKIV